MNIFQTVDKPLYFLMLGFIFKLLGQFSLNFSQVFIVELDELYVSIWAFNELFDDFA